MSDDTSSRPTDKIDDMPEKDAKAEENVKGGAWYAKFDGVDASVKRPAASGFQGTHFDDQA